MTRALRLADQQVNHKQVERLMCAHGTSKAFAATCQRLARQSMSQTRSCLENCVAEALLALQVELLDLHHRNETTTEPTPPACCTTRGMMRRTNPSPRSGELQLTVDER